MDNSNEYQPEHEPGHEYQPEQEPGNEYQPEHEPGHEYQPEHEPGHEYQIEAELEYQPELEAELEYQPELEAELEYQPEIEAGHEYKPEQEAEEEPDPEEEAAEQQEYELEDEAGQGYHQKHENEEEYQPQNEDELEHDIGDDNGTEDGIPEIPHLDEKQDNAAEPEALGGEKWPGWPGESVFRMLVPAQKVGSIIGRKGEYIKKTCEETKARIKILDGPPGTRERAVMVSAKEEPDVPRPSAVEGLLQVHKRVLDGLENDGSAPALGGKVSTRLLVPAAQAGSLIGKQGTTVKSIQDESSCVVRVLGTEELPVFALQDDRVVEVVGEATGIHKALELIATHLRKFLVDRSIISVIEMQMQTPNPPIEHMPPPPQHWGPPPPQSFPSATHGGFAASPRFMQPSRQQQYDNYYPPGDIPPQDKQPHQGISAYGREAQIMHSSSAQAPSSVITQITQQMQIPLSYADAVIGTQGATISYIRRISGATVTIQETRGVPTEMTVEISGTASQVQAAQQLIQNFMADAQGSAQQQNPPSAEQMYGSYVAHGAAPNPSQGGGYSSVYGNSYGY